MQNDPEHPHQEEPARAGRGDSSPGPAGDPASSRRHRLAYQIGVFYTLLAVINIVFFSIMIFENQTDLLQINFRYHSESIVKTVLGDLGQLTFPRNAADNQAELDKLETSLAPFDIRYYLLFDRQGQIWHSGSAPGFTAPDTVSPQLRDRTDELINQELVFRSRYSMVLNEGDFSVDLLLPLRGIGPRGPEKIFLATSLSIRDMQARLNALYYQVAVAVLWGIVFHVLFALLVFRLIFRRLGLLKIASSRMARGELGARSGFAASAAGGLARPGKLDELDELGLAFDTMAASIQDQVETISRQMETIQDLNDEIQLEMRIGKEVQDSFASVNTDMALFKPAVFYQPLREVSGDIYNFYPLRGGGHALFFADATGHGVSAALITAIAMLSLEELLRNTGLCAGRATDRSDREAPVREPENFPANWNAGDGEGLAAGIMTGLNGILAARLNPYFHATAILCLILPDGRLIYSSAGHTPCYAARPATGEQFTLQAHGTPLGMVEEMQISSETLSIRPGDRLLIYSDGYTEAYNARGEEYGRDRARRIFHENAHLEPQAILDTIKQDLFSFTRDFKDDVTILVLEIPAGPSAHASFELRASP